MSNTVIKVENISKQYRLGQVSTGTLSHDLNRWWHTVRGKDDPYLKIGETNDRTTTGESDYVWALRDINFEVKQGEVLGIIGRNGAGKSTLLKILSRTAAPTTGSIKIKGRVASLLEVGTGFHPELSGRENIFLNGAILGMTKNEIKRKFDEIIDFAGVERYIDTPVKRYSSGMYVRLAFAVAAHLEPEILIVDEVLAVGDAEFQKKCLGKMKDVSEREGRTVLFVSHNMLAVKNICNAALIMEHGKVKGMGEVNFAVTKYLKGDKISPKEILFSESEGIVSDTIKLISARLITSNSSIRREDKIFVEVVFKQNIGQAFFINLILRHLSGDVVFEAPSEIVELPEGNVKVVFELPDNFFNSDVYTIQLNFTTKGIRLLGYVRDLLEFEIAEATLMENFYGKLTGYVRPQINSSIKLID